MSPTFHIEYEQDGELRTESLEAPNPGAAFAKCLKLHPEAVLVRCFRFGKLPGGGHLEISYDPPPVQRAIQPDPRPPRTHHVPTSQENTFPFFSDIKPKPKEKRR